MKSSIKSIEDSIKFMKICDLSNQLSPKPARHDHAQQQDIPTSVYVIN